MKRGRIIIIGVGIGLLIAAPEGARAEDRPPSGCRAAGQFVASMARADGRAFGEFSSELAQLGLRDDVAQQLRSALCDPEA